MFKQNHYVPVLKWKRGERNALENLDTSLKKFMTPLIEIQPITFDHAKGEFKKTIDSHLCNLGPEIKKSWGVDDPIFIDVDSLYLNENFTDEFVESGEHTVECIIHAAEDEGIFAIPVTGLQRSEEFQLAINRMSQLYNRGVCIRLEESDLADLDTLPERLFDLTNSLNLNANQIDIIFDYKQITLATPLSIKEYTEKLLITMARFPELQSWRTFTVLATAYPKNLNKIPTLSEGSLPRSEWIAYKELKKLQLARIPSFGDYNINNPQFVNIDPRLLTLGANVRYTAKDDFLIFRGGAIKKYKFNQMVQIANSIIRNPGYYGQNFSYGDKYIFDCAKGNAGTGNSETWVTVGINHHLTLVAHDFSNLFSVSTSS